MKNQAVINNIAIPKDEERAMNYYQDYLALCLAHDEIPIKPKDYINEIISQQKGETDKVLCQHEFERSNNLLGFLLVGNKLYKALTD